MGVVENLNGGREALPLPFPLPFPLLWEPLVWLGGGVGAGFAGGGVTGAIGVKAMGAEGVTCRWLKVNVSV